MSALEQFLHQTNSYPTLIIAALAHVQFETIHPFLDGNGRIGRLLISFILHHAKVLGNPLLYLSLYFKQNRSEYYRLLDVVRKEGDCEAWIDFFLEGVHSTAVNAEKTAQKLVSLFRADESKIDQLGRAALLTRNIFRFFRERPIINPKKIIQRAGVTSPSVNKGIAALHNLEIIEEITGKQRNRIYAYKQYLALLNEDG
jgi:Fic family protein